MNEESVGMKRVLKTSDLAVFGMMIMIPIAPMAWYGTLVGPGMGMVAMGYSVALVAMLFTGLAYAEMSHKYPMGGSVYRYVQQSTKPALGFLAGWGLMIAYFFTPAVAFAVGGLFASFIFPSIPMVVWVIGFAIFAGVISWLGIETSTKIAWVMFGLEMIIVIWFIVAVVIKLTQGEISVNMNGFVNPNVDFDMRAVLSATVVVILSYVGFDAISTLAEEAKDPKRMIGRATIISIVTMGLLFALIAWVAGWVVPDYSTLPEDEGSFMIILEMVGGTPLKVCGALALVLSFGVACGIDSLTACTRMLYSMSKDGVIPRVFDKLNKNKAPGIAVVFMAVVSVLLYVILGFNVIAQVTAIGSLIGFMSVDLAVAWRLYIKADANDHRSVLKHLIIPLLGFLVCLGIAVTSNTFSLLFAGGWMLAGFLWLLYVTKGFSKPTPSLDINA